MTSVKRIASNVGYTLATIIFLPIYVVGYILGALSALQEVLSGRHIK